ncbi:hypothetical protein AB0M02_35740 [Actinoplanes sp. NPDC051861]|uniref:hypothetical protein n=1 Tax=Actinoplanes sp. NPDC051861 TaxID=3155170 RepID=UPI003435448A
MQLTEMSVIGIRTAVTVFRRRPGGLRFVVIPTIHVGRPDYYQAIAERLRSCVAVVAEQYDGPSSTGMAYAAALRLTRQRIGRDLVHQDIDYGALGVPIIFPDAVEGLEAGPDRTLPRNGWIDVALLTPPLALDMALTSREWIAERDLEVDDDTEFELPTKWLQRKVMTERDELLLGVLREIDGEFADEDMEVAVVFGAAHMPTVVRELTGPMRYRVAPGARWLTAVDF